MNKLTLSPARSMTSPLTTRRRWMTMGIGALLALVLVVRADVPAGWKSYRGNFFKIGVPPGFAVQTQGEPGSGGKHDELSLWNEKQQVEFSVYSPQWNGEAIFMNVASRAETLKSREVKKVGNVQEVQMEIAAQDKSYIRFVVSRTKLNENTNTTFGVRIPNMKVYEQIKPTYVKWKASLEQYAD